MGSGYAFVAGASIGLTMAAPIGPMAAIVIHRTLAGGFSAGLATGAGASTMNFVYAAVAVTGLDSVSKLVSEYETEFQALTSCVLLVLATRMIFRISAGAGVSDRRSVSMFRHYVSALAFNSVNPLSLLLLFGAMAAFTGLAAQGTQATLAIVGGVFLGSIAWWIALVAVIALVGVRISPARARILDLAAATFLLVLATVPIVRLI